MPPMRMPHVHVPPIRIIPAPLRLWLTERFGPLGQIAALGVPELWVLGSTLQANQASLYPAGAAIDFRGMGADSSRVDLIETTISRNHGEGLFLSGSGRTGTSAWLWGSQMQMNFLDLNRTLAAANVDCGDLAALNIDNATAFEPSGMSGPAQWVLCRSTCLPAQPGRCNIRKPEPWAVTSSGIAPDEQRQNLLIRNVTVDVLYLLPVEEGFLPRCRWTAAPLVPVVETSALVVGPTRIACEPTSYPRFTDHLTLEVSSEGYTWSEPVNFLFDWPNPTMGMLPLILGISIPVGLFFLGMIVFVWWFRVRRAKRTNPPIRRKNGHERVTMPAGWASLCVTQAMQQRSPRREEPPSGRSDDESDPTDSSADWDDWDTYAQPLHPPKFDDQPDTKMDRQTKEHDENSKSQAPLSTSTSGQAATQRRTTYITQDAPQGSEQAPASAPASALS
ncbi:hypothetical protein PAPYR_4271 [Paratrimastix pyriformis]|uniref:Uncharacterized protein n=1 Tax=Paratrimastix pyriformis TaxID=342808 RepID=A0ABQ8US37_9EUKA|nr:hypothetical protein PAPYR_4271 [Paratrimastix pyriformis]